MKERHGFKKKGKNENNKVKNRHGSNMSHLHAYPACFTPPPFVFKCFCSYSCTDLLFALDLIPLKQSGCLRTADTLYLRMTNEPKKGCNRLFNKTQTHLRGRSNLPKAHKLALCTQSKAHRRLC